MPSPSLANLGLQLAARARRHPEDERVLHQLLSWCERTGHSIFTFPDLPRYLAGAWIRSPRDPALSEFVLPPLGLAHDPEPPSRAPRWWRRSGRVAGEVGDLHDRATGLPLTMIRVADGARLLLVPGGEGTEPFYIDESPVGFGAFAASGAEVDLSVRLDHAGDDRRPVYLATATGVRTYLEWSCGDLPDREEWWRAVLGVGGLRLSSLQAGAGLSRAALRIAVLSRRADGYGVVPCCDLGLRNLVLPEPERGRLELVVEELGEMARLRSHRYGPYTWEDDRPRARVPYSTTYRRLRVVHRVLARVRDVHGVPLPGDPLRSLEGPRVNLLACGPSTAEPREAAGGWGWVPQTVLAAAAGFAADPEEAWEDVPLAPDPLPPLAEPVPPLPARRLLDADRPGERDAHLRQVRDRVQLDGSPGECLRSLTAALGVSAEGPVRRGLPSLLPGLVPPREDLRAGPGRIHQLLRERLEAAPRSPRAREEAAAILLGFGLSWLPVLVDSERRRWLGAVEDLLGADPPDSLRLRLSLVRARLRRLRGGDEPAGGGRGRRSAGPVGNWNSPLEQAWLQLETARDLGVVELDAALEALDRGVELLGRTGAPASRRGEFHFVRGCLLLRAGRLDEAAASARAAFLDDLEGLEDGRLLQAADLGLLALVADRREDREVAWEAARLLISRMRKGLRTYGFSDSMDLDPGVLELLRSRQAAEAGAHELVLGELLRVSRYWPVMTYSMRWSEMLEAGRRQWDLGQVERFAELVPGSPGWTDRGGTIGPALQACLEALARAGFLLAPTA